MLKKLSTRYITLSFGILSFPALVFADAAQNAAKEAAGFVVKFNEIILYPTIGLLSGIAFLFFIWGVAQYVMNADNDSARQEGVKHITYGIIGLFVMITAFTILELFAATFGLEKKLDCADDPSLVGCENEFKAP